MSDMDLVSVAQMFKDQYPRAGERIKQYVVDGRREYEWELKTCPRVEVASHDDNTGLTCRNEGPTPWTYLNHDCCYVCGDLHEETRARPDVATWLIEKAARPPIEQDRTKLSDEIAEDVALREHPTMLMLRR